MVAEETLVAFARRRRKQKRDDVYYRRNRDAINERRRAKYERDRLLSRQLEEELRGQAESQREPEEPTDRG